MGKFQIFKSTVNSQYYFRLKSGNNETILASEGYHYKSSCQDGISSVKRNAPLDNRFINSDKPGNYTFKLVGANGEPIGRSESYTTAYSRDNGVAAVKREAPLAWTEDLT